MFRRYPYWGWLLLCLLLWGINGYYFYQHRQALLPERMARAVNNDLQHREDVYERFIQEQDIVRKMFLDSLSEDDVKRVIKLPFYVYAYNGDSLTFWNTNDIIPGCSDSALGKPVILRNDRGVYIAKCIRPPHTSGGERIVTLFPVLITYPIENDYLKSHFPASEYIPVKTRIIAADKPHASAYPVTMRDAGTLFYIRFNGEEIQKWIPGPFFIVLLISALVASMSWIQLMIIHLTRNKSSVTGFVITFTLIVIVRSLLYIYGLPFNLDTLLFFSPRLYASSKYLSSFGDLFINTLCFLWLVMFITRHTPYKTYFSALHAWWARYSIAGLLISGLVAYVFFFVNVIRSLVLDSNISFDVGHFYAINGYSILGLLVIGVITGISCMVIYLVNVQLAVIIRNKWFKYFFVVLIGVAFLFVSDNYHDRFYWALMAWLFLFIPLLDIRNFTLVSDLFEPHMIFWAVFICGFCTGILQYFNNAKELMIRRAFVEENLSPHRDNILEYAFDKTANFIAQDKTLKNYLHKPTAPARKGINERFETIYLTAAVSKYQPSLYLYDAEGKALFNKDTIDFNFFKAEKEEMASTTSPYLFYKETILDKHSYLAYIPIYSDSINEKIGYVLIDLELKKQVTETVYPELLLQTANKGNLKENEYAYAVYVNGKWITQVNDYPFTTNLKYDTLGEQHFNIRNNNNVSELYYKISDKRTIVVVHNRNELVEMATLFSYLFGIQILLAIFILFYQLYLSYFAGALSSGKFMRLTLRRRVHFSMLALVLISFLIIGTVTIVFFTFQYKTSNSTKLQSAMQVSKQSVQDYLKRENAFDSEYRFDTVSQSGRFRDFITILANGQKIDINIFDDKGRLFNTSEDEIYNKGLISRVMMPEAFYQMNELGKSIAIQNEKIADLSYLSAYEPLRDENGVTLGYINVPFFSSEKELNFQISNIVITLINIYAFLFLISGLISVFITQWITRTFDVIIQQFGRLNLQRNERITWPYDDEIGMLVKEYNKMVNKVEENAALLAQSEREMAWREMARQVAHEIKNPLTPMKLNIQYLQQAMKNDNPNIKELTNRVSDSIIEQIDNLSYIASEFSNFAKMPEARPEELELRELLHKAVELYLDDARIKVTINAGAVPLYVQSDRSQLMRVCTNLLENAKQAIPETRNGLIEVSLKAENNSALIIIADNGDGISEEVAKRIFQPYFTTKSSGTGLGLAMTKKIIEFWKGEIWFESKEGIGTSFYIRLPQVRKA
jgi:two-component system nitrogen regulation sensor histidine kinase NtrY